MIVYVANPCAMGYPKGIKVKDQKILAFNLTFTDNLSTAAVHASWTGTKQQIMWPPVERDCLPAAGLRPWAPLPIPEQVNSAFHSASPVTCSFLVPSISVGRFADPAPITLMQVAQKSSTIHFISKNATNSGARISLLFGGFLWGGTHYLLLLVWSPAFLFLDLIITVGFTRLQNNSFYIF